MGVRASLRQSPDSNRTNTRAFETVSPTAPGCQANGFGIAVPLAQGGSDPTAMHKRFFSGGCLALAATFSSLTGCNKPQPNAPSQDFARRHQCPVARVTSFKESAEQMRVKGCGESELYVRTCERRGGAPPAPESRQPLTEGEARLAPRPPPSSEQGCAWAREQKQPAPPAGSVAPPKWLSVP